MSLQATPSRIDREFLAECDHVPWREIMPPLGSVGNLPNGLEKGQHPVLTRPLGLCIVQSEQNRRADLAGAAVFARGDLPDISDDAGSNFIENGPGILP